MCTCSDLHPTPLASREDTASQACLPDLYHCKQNSDCCSKKCYGSRLGGLLCWSPPLETANGDIASVIDSSALKQEVTRQLEEPTCKIEGEDCSGRQDVKCCSDYCWCSPHNRAGCTCADPPNYLAGDATRDTSDLEHEVVREVEQPICAKTNESCSGDNSECCSGFCRCKLMFPYDCTCAKHLSAVTDIDITDSLMSGKRDTDSFEPTVPDKETLSGDVNHETRGPKPKPKPKCVADFEWCDHNEDCCSKKCESGHCRSAGQAINDRDNFNFMSDTLNDATEEAKILLTTGIPLGMPCKINKLMCAGDQDCCSSYCKSGKCQNKIPEIRDDAAGVPPIPPCRKTEGKCFAHNQCCSHNCDSGICKAKSLENRIADLSRAETQIDKLEDHTTSQRAGGDVPPPPCKGPGVICRDHRECCYGRCMSNNKCWKPSGALS